MVTVITRTIGSSGRDFATVALAEAAVGTIGTSSDLVANNEAIVFEIDAGNYSDLVTIDSSLTTDSTRNVTYKPATGSEHGGKLNQGVIVAESQDTSLRIRDAHTIINGLVLRATVAVDEGCTIKNSIVYCPHRTTGIDVDPVTDEVLIENCFIEASNRCILLQNNASTLKVKSSTFHNTGIGIKVGTNTVLSVFNCFAPINLTDSSDTSVLAGSGNVTSQTDFESLTIPASNGLLAGNQTWTPTIITDASSTGSLAIYDPYTCKLYDVSGNSAWHVLSSLENVTTTDIAGVTRSASGFNPGAYEADARVIVLPGRVFNPSPSNGAENVATDTTLNWSEPAGTITSRKILLGTSSTLTDSDLVATTAAPVTLEISLDNGQEYYWRVDLTNEFGTTSGITFVFETSAPVISAATEGEGDTTTTTPSPPIDPLTPGLGGKAQSGATVGFVGTASSLNTTWDGSSIESRSRSWPTREGDVRAKIFKMTQAKSNISFIYRESLRSMIASFNDVGHFNSEDKFVDIKCIHGNAERAIAKLKQENSIILPMISVAQTISDNDDERRRYESVLVHEKYFDEEKNRAFRILSLAPRPVNINYQVNIWCKYMADMDQILEQIRLKFNPEMNVPTEFSTLAKAFITSEEAVGSMTANDKDDRVIKKTINITLRTYIPSPKFLVTSTGQIEEFNILKT